jgi:hypothetical protein
VNPSVQLAIKRFDKSKSEQKIETSNFKFKKKSVLFRPILAKGIWWKREDEYSRLILLKYYKHS